MLKSDARGCSLFFQSAQKLALTLILPEGHQLTSVSAWMFLEFLCPLRFRKVASVHAGSMAGGAWAINAANKVYGLLAVRCSPAKIAWGTVFWQTAW